MKFKNFVMKFIDIVIGKFYSTILGLFFVAISCMLFLSLVTYSKKDPSFWNATNSAIRVKNIFGMIGAYISDFFFQFFGVGAIMLCLVIFAWGVMLIYDGKIKNIFSKLSNLVLFIISFSALLGYIKISQQVYFGFCGLGGAVGCMINSAFSNAKISFVVFLMSIIASIISISVIIELTVDDWKLFCKFMLYSLYKLCLVGLKLCRKILSDSVYRNIEKLLSFNLQKNSIKPVVKKLERAEIVNNGYQLPSISLMQNRKAAEKKKDYTMLSEMSGSLMQTLNDYGVNGKIMGAIQGPVVTLFKFEPVAGTKASRVTGLSDDIARSMSTVSARIDTIAGTTALGIEIPNKSKEMIYLKEILESEEYKNTEAKLPLILGRMIDSQPCVVDLAKMPHLLIAGTTGSGKSVGINTMILSLLYKLTPDECKFIMIDPKMLELSIYNDIPHLLTPVVTDAKKAVNTLKWIVAEMERRYKMMSSLNVRGIENYNQKIKETLDSGKKLYRRALVGYDDKSGDPLVENIEIKTETFPFIVVIIDEMADLMLVAGKELESYIQRLAQMARAAGIHIITATQRPSVDVITGVIKANFPTRISFKVTSKIDSRTILGTQGAEQLLGQGDMIYMSSNNRMTRIHGPFVADGEVEDVVNYCKSQAKPNYIESIGIDSEEDDSSNGEGDFSGGDDNSLYKQAVAIVKNERKTSISYIQRKLRIGYNKAANFVEKMEEDGILSSPNHQGKREIMED